MGGVTIKWKIEDDNLKVHSTIIQNVNYISESPIRLLSLYNWYQQASENHQKSDGTWCATKAKYFTLYWYQ